jgi:hypothetical protein
MSIRYLPRELLKRLVPKKKIEKLVTQRFTLNRATLNVLADANFLSKSTLEDVALKVIKQYKNKFEDSVGSGESEAQAAEDALNDKKLMVQRVQNSVVFQIKEEIKDQYFGEFYRWLPSSAETPDPLHQLNYGKTFQIGKGEMPGDRWGCQCGMEILVQEKKLQL